MELLELKDLTIHYFTDEGVVRAVNGLTLSVGAGETAVSYTHLDVYKRQGPRSIDKVLAEAGTEK